MMSLAAGLWIFNPSSLIVKIRKSLLDNQEKLAFQPQEK